MSGHRRQRGLFLVLSGLPLAPANGRSFPALSAHLALSSCWREEHVLVPKSQSPNHNVHMVFHCRALPKSLSAPWTVTWGCGSG